MFVNYSRRIVIGVIGMLAALLAGQASAETNLRMQAPSPGSTPYVLEVAIQSLLQNRLPVKINLTAGKASTRSALDASKGATDLYLSSPAVSGYMKSGSKMFSGISDAPKLYKNLRGLFNFPLGQYHIVVHADSGITSLKQIKGKRVFIGPPGGAATVVAIAIIKGVTGYKPGVDYDMAKLDWTSGSQAFQDDQVALMIVPQLVPSPLLQQIALLQKIRLLDIPDKAFKSKPIAKLLTAAGYTRSTIPAGAYGDHQVNTKPVNAISSWVGIGTNKLLDEDLAYKITKTVFDNIETIHKTASFLGSVNIDNALKQMVTPLHPGAVRYYRERGITIPERLLPPKMAHQ